MCPCRETVSNLGSSVAMAEPPGSPSASKVPAGRVCFKKVSNIVTFKLAWQRHALYQQTGALRADARF